MEERTLESRRIYEGRVINLRIDTVLLPSGRQTKREVVEHGDCVAIIPLDSDGDVVLVRQFRKAAGKVLLEIPAGNVDPGESPEQAATRELGEETTLEAGKVERLIGFYTSPGYSSEYLHLYLATDLKHGKLSPMEDESIEVVRVPLSHIPRLVASGEICDGKSIAGLLTFISLRENPANSA